MTMNVLITGATGYIGSALVKECLNLDMHVKAVIRKQQSLEDNIDQILVSDLTLKSDWLDALNEVDVIIHTAARAHILQDSSKDPLSEFRKINTDVTLNLARQAAKIGVRQFIFISSIGVNGNISSTPFTEKDLANPQEPYAISKYEAEQGLLALARETDLEIVIIRPPLVYGPKAPGNFGRLIQFVYEFVVLPFGAVDNRRSFVALDNLISFIIHCIGNQKAANEVFLISDGEEITTTELLRKVATAFDKKTFLIPVPVCLMTFAAKLLGKGGIAIRLFGSLEVDSSKARDLLGWEPIISMDEELEKIAKDYLRKI